jgi:hypothetical protein
VQRRQRFAEFGEKRDLGAGVRLQLQDEPFTLTGNGGRLDHAAAEDDGFAGGGVDVGRGTGGVQDGGQRSGGEERERGTDGAERAELAQMRDNGKQNETADGGEKLGLAEGYGAGSQDAGGNDSRGTHQRVAHGRQL